MLRILKWKLILILFTSPLNAQLPEDLNEYQHYWSQWRGPLATGESPYGDPPVEWNENKNIRWKIEIPGRGQSTPIIWDDNVFILTAIETEQTGDSSRFAKADKRLPDWMHRRGVKPTNIVEFVVLAINRKDGSILWRRTARTEQPHEGRHSDGSYAPNSPVTDGEHLFAYFGSRGLYSFDMAGTLDWATDFGDKTIRYGMGEGSSPALYKDKIVVNWDHEGDSFIVALDKLTGKECWRCQRDEGTSWATPIIVENNSNPVVIINASKGTCCYDFETGELKWKVGAMTVNTISSPVYNDGMLYVMSGHKGSILQAFRLVGANCQPNLVWDFKRDTPYVPSPLLCGDCLYFMTGNKGILSCFDAPTGHANYGPQRLKGITNIYASPVAANNHVYITSREGTTLVLNQSKDFSVLATNSLSDRFDASAAIVDGELYLRGEKYLYCIAEPGN